MASPILSGNKLLDICIDLIYTDQPFWYFIFGWNDENDKITVEYANYNNEYICRLTSFKRTIFNLRGYNKELIISELFKYNNKKITFLEVKYKKE